LGEQEAAFGLPFVFPAIVIPPLASTVQQNPGFAPIIDLTVLHDPCRSRACSRWPDSRPVSRWCTYPFLAV